MKEASIVIRTFNEEKHIGNLLRAIKKQDHKDYEVIIVDSGSTDRTLEIVEEFDAEVIKIEPRDFTFGYALNIGCEAASGKYLVFVSAHIIPTDNKWLSNLLIPFQDKKVAMVYGRQIGNSESKFSEKMDFERLFGTSTLNYNVVKDYANNANSAIRKDLWKKESFDEYLFGLEDIDWAKNMAKRGYRVHYEPKSVIYHIHEEEWHQVFNRYRREAIAAVRIGLKEPPQVKVGIIWTLINFLHDMLNSFPNFSSERVNEIVKFRYYQWKGNREGWLQGKDIDFDVERSSVFRPTENQAVVIKGRNKAEMEGMPLPDMKPGDILIRVDYVGVCSTDLEIYKSTLGYYRDGLADYPIVPGHEFSGTIARIGSNNKFQELFKVGQRVVGECILSRGEDSERKELGVINHNGAYSQYVVMSGDAIHTVPENIDSKTAAITEPLAVALRAMRRIESRLLPQTKIAIMGAGPIGNLFAQVLKLKGYEVDVFDYNKKRLKLLKKLGINTFNELNDLKKYKILVEATGSEEVLEQIINRSSDDSTTLLLGFPYGTISYNFEDLAGHEKMFIGSVGSDKEDFIKALELLPTLDTSDFTKKALPLKDFKKAWEIHETSQFIKILLKP